VSTRGQADIVARVDNDAALTDDGRDALKAFFTKVKAEGGRS